MCQFSLQPIAEAYLPLQITELVPCRKYGKIISHECEWAVHYQFFIAGALWKWMTHFWLKPMKPMFSDFKSKVPLNLKTIWKQKSFKLLEDKIYTVGVAWGPACNHGFRNFFLSSRSPQRRQKDIYNWFGKNLYLVKIWSPPHIGAATEGVRSHLNPNTSCRWNVFFFCLSQDEGQRDSYELINFL